MCMLSAVASVLAVAAYLPVTPLRSVIAARAPSPLLQEQETVTSPSFNPFGQAKVPKGQQPLRELKDLRRQPFYDWAEDDQYSSRITNVYWVIMLFISLPVSYTTFDQLPYELPQLFLSASIGTFAVMLPFIFRLRVGWGYVSGRLKERKTYYEANQRGLFANKDRETQLRDRLIQQQEVAPALRRVDSSLLTVALCLALSLGGGEVLTLVEGEAGPSTLKTLSGDEAMRYTNRLRSDEAFALREQQRAQRKAQPDGSGVKPVYCDSRYYKILAGGNGQGGVGCN